MKAFDKKKKEMAKKMDINMGSSSEASSHIPGGLKRGNRLDNVGKTASKKSTIDSPGQKNNTSRKMP